MLAQNFAWSETQQQKKRTSSHQNWHTAGKEICEFFLHKSNLNGLNAVTKNAKAIVNLNKKYIWKSLKKEKLCFWCEPSINSSFFFFFYCCSNQSNLYSKYLLHVGCKEKNPDVSCIQARKKIFRHLFLSSIWSWT